MYLDKIRTETRRIFKRGFDAFIYELRKSTEQKLIERILSNHDRIRMNLTKDLNKLTANSSLIECKIDNEFYIENSSFYRNLLNCESENNEIQIIIREIESQFRDLSIKADNLSFDFDKQEARKNIDEEINLKITSFTKNLEDYLRAILVYKHFNKNNVKQKELYKPIEGKLYLCFEDYFKDTLEFKSTIAILQENQIINNENEFNQKYIKPKIIMYVLIAKLIDLDCISFPYDSNSALSEKASKFFKINFEYTQFNKVLNQYRTTPKWKKMFDKFNYLDKEFNKL